MNKLIWSTAVEKKILPENSLHLQPESLSKDNGPAGFVNQNQI